MKTQLVGHYSKNRYDGKIQVGFIMLKQMYYDTLEEAQREWSGYIWEDGKIYQPINEAERFFAVDSRYGFRTIHRNVIQESSGSNRCFRCVDCGQTFTESITSPIFHSYNSPDTSIDNFKNYTRCK